MSEKKNKTTKAAKKSGAGNSAETGPLQVNWFIIGGAILIVGLIVFFSIRQQQQQADQAALATQAAQTTQATQAAQAIQTTQAAQVAQLAGASGTTMPGCTPQDKPCPPLTIDPAKQYTATVKMAKGGEFKIQLLAAKAPLTVNSFVYLARQGFFNGVTFHRVLDGFMAQGGDPTGTGGGGPGYEFVNEKNDLKFDKAGVVAMANSGPDTNGSQFFIMFGPYGLSEDNYTIFGQVDASGLEVVNAITKRDPDTSPTFTGDAMESVTIEEK
jgi:cyclophilin family peptidyl-prolyl cis-trans isomerase